MSCAPTDYIHLLSSLSRMPANIDDSYRLETEITMARRQAVLPFDEQALLGELRPLMAAATPVWLDESSSATNKFKQLLASIVDLPLTRLVTDLMNVRVCITAIVARHSHKTLALDIYPGGLSHRISRNWQAQDFGLSQHLPWLAKANRLVEQNRFYQLEQLILRLCWRLCKRTDGYLDYGFAKVVVYALQWDLVNQWQSCEQQAAARQFATMLDAYPCVLQE